MDNSVKPCGETRCRSGVIRLGYDGSLYKPFLYCGKCLTRGPVAETAEQARVAWNFMNRRYD